MKVDCLVQQLCLPSRLCSHYLSFFCEQTDFSFVLGALLKHRQVQEAQPEVGSVFLQTSQKRGTHGGRRFDRRLNLMPKLSVATPWWDTARAPASGVYISATPKAALKDIFQ